jgi:anti-sigma factor ChrR (cupin superfamily)
VLEGGYRDEVGTYNPGDFALAPAGSAHRIVSKRDEGCVTLLLVRAEPRYTTLLGKLLSPLIWV